MINVEQYQVWHCLLIDCLLGDWPGVINYTEKNMFSSYFYYKGLVSVKVLKYFPPNSPEHADNDPNIILLISQSFHR